MTAAHTELNLPRIRSWMKQGTFCEIEGTYIETISMFDRWMFEVFRWHMVAL